MSYSENVDGLGLEHCHEQQNKRQLQQDDGAVDHVVLREFLGSGSIDQVVIL